MKRDWDVIREVMIEVEGLDDAQRTDFVYGRGDGDATKAEHALLCGRPATSKRSMRARWTDLPSFRRI